MAKKNRAPASAAASTAASSSGAKKLKKKKKHNADAVQGDESAGQAAGEDFEDILGDGPAEDSFSVSEKFAKKFNEKRDKMEAARAAKILAEQGIASDSEDESTEDEQAELLTGRIETKIFDTLSKIKAKDPSIYDSKQSFFDDDDFKEETSTKKSGADSSGKKMTYKNFIRDTLLKEGADALTREEDEMEKGIKKGKKTLKTPAEEQRDLQAEIKAAALTLDDDDDGDLFAMKEQDPEEKARMDQEFAKFAAVADKQDKGEEIISHFWQGDEELDENERFLRDYVVNKQWMETESMQTQPLPGSKKNMLDDDSEEEEHLEEADEFEKEYNFRFEVEEGKQIQGHQRFPENSVRERNDKRKRQRKEKAERQEAEKTRRAEELKRLKNIKKQEIQRRLDQIGEVTGNKATSLDASVLDDEFDPDEHDKKMANILGNDYDEEEETLDAKELVQAPKGANDLDVSSAGNEGLRKHWGVGYDDQEDDNDNNEGNTEVENAEGQDDEEDHDPELWFLCDSCNKPIPGGKRRFDCTVCENYTLCMKCFRVRRHPHKFIRKRVPESCTPPGDWTATQAEPEDDGEQNQTLDDYFQLDYEDIIGGDLPTRFKYRKVEADNFGIPAHVILQKTGRELNQMVSLKKLRPYRGDPGEDVEEDWGASGSHGGKKGKGRGGKGGKAKGRGRDHDQMARQGKKGKKGSDSKQEGGLDASRLSSYNLESDRLHGFSFKHKQKNRGKS